MSSRIKNTFESFKLGPKLPDSCVIATYVWIDAHQEVRSKSRVLQSRVEKPEDAPVWNFDGSSTEQATGRNSDCWIKPVAVFKDPFRLEPHVLVLCEVYNFDWTPALGNSRESCAKITQEAAVQEAKPWFGIEQEYSILELSEQPVGWPKGGFPGPQGPYYCGVGAGKAIGREIVETHLHHCLYAGVKVCGTNAEVMATQWEFQVGICEGPTEIGDHLWMARYILKMVAEEYNYCITFDPKPVKGSWNGAGCHTNFSTEAMRVPNGISEINSAIAKLGSRPNTHLRAYDASRGEDNKRRLVGAFETASYKEFSSGVADRGASVRIPRHCESEGCGYLEDRRPAANCDPYSVAEILVRTTILNETGDSEAI